MFEGAELRCLSLTLGFVAAWSMPIKSSGGTLLGTFGTSEIPKERFHGPWIYSRSSSGTLRRGERHLRHESVSGGSLPSGFGVVGAGMPQRKGLPSWRWLQVFTCITLGAAGTGSKGLAGSFADDFMPWLTAKGRDGNYYGAMLEGGVAGGSAYTLSSKGVVRSLHRFAIFRFSGVPSLLGGGPEGVLSTGQDGSVYGTTREGGVFGSGVLYKIDRRGRYSSLYHLDGGAYYKGATLAAENGDLFFSSTERIFRLTREGAQTVFPASDRATVLAESTNHEIFFGSFDGNLKRLNSSDEFESFASVGSFPQQLVPLADGGFLCVSLPSLLSISKTGVVTTIHEFNVPFEGLEPNFVVIAKDGSYIGSTRKGGIENNGVVFRIVPQTNTYTVLSHLHNPGGLGAGLFWRKEVLPLRVAADSGNRPPCAADDFVPAAQLKSSVGGLPQAVIPVLKNDFDADRDPLSIVSVGPAAHGTASLDFVAQKITYTGGSSVVQNDSFSYTIVDGSGGSSTGYVAIRTNAAGRYVGVVKTVPNVGGDPGTQVGDLALTMKADRTFTARFNLLERTYRFVGRFNERNGFGAVLQSNPRQGTRNSLRLWLRPDGVDWTVEVTSDKNGQPYTATCTRSVNTF